jgi:hypothetical protein
VLGIKNRTLMNEPKSVSNSPSIPTTEKKERGIKNKHNIKFRRFHTTIVAMEEQ